MLDFHSRHRALFDPTVVESKRVLLVGCGSVGSFAATLLARAGIRRFVLVDPDTVEVTNLSRCAYGEADMGQLKVDALARALRAIRAPLEIDTHAAELGALDDRELLSLLRNVDLVFASTDHPPTQARLGVLSYHVVPAVFAGVYAKGVGGEVLWTRPEETPCYACVLGAVRGAHAPPRGHLEYGLTTGQLAAEPALGVDILAVTTRAVKIALSLLLAPHDPRFGEAVDPSRNVLFVGNSVDWIWQEPFETLWARATRRESCVCRLKPGESTARLALDTGDDL